MGRARVCVFCFSLGAWNGPRWRNEEPARMQDLRLFKELKDQGGASTEKRKMQGPDGMRP